MSKYDDAERHAIKELDPEGYCAWQLVGLDPDLVWYTWLETQVAPPQGLPQLRCDCVAGFLSRSGKQAPWACLIEAQAQPLPRMAVWMLVYLGLLHHDLRCGPHDQDRFRMMGALLNLTDTTLSSDIDWLPPVIADATEAKGPMGMWSRFWVRNARKESAEGTLDDIASDKTALCILVWVPLMVGGDNPDVQQRWKELALRQDQAHLRADYVTLALTFAELAGQKDSWATALKEFDVKDFSFLQEIEDRGIEKGLVKGALVGKIQAFQEMLKQPPTPEKELTRLSESDLSVRLDQLRRQLLNGA